MPHKKLSSYYDYHVRYISRFICIATRLWFIVYVNNVALRRCILGGRLLLIGEIFMPL